MADLITIKSGALGDRQAMPKLSTDELGYCTDEEALYIGAESENKRLCGAKDVGNINTRLDALSATITSILAQISSINEQLGDIPSQISNINSQITDITARLEEMETPTE